MENNNLDKKPNKSSKNSYTKKDIDRIIELRKQGKTYKYIGELYGVSPRAITDLLERHGIKLGKVKRVNNFVLNDSIKNDIIEMYKNRASIKDIAIKYNTTYYIITNILKESGYYKSEKPKKGCRCVDTKIVDEYLTNGLSQVEIAEKLGVSQSTIKNIAKELGYNGKRNEITEYTKDKVVEMYTNGASIDSIIENMNLSRALIYKVLRSKGVTKKGRTPEYTRILNSAIEEVVSGEKISRVSKKYGISKDTIKLELYKIGKYSSVNEDHMVEKAIAMYEAGVSERSIKLATGVSLYTIEHRLKQEKLEEIFKEAKNILDGLDGAEKEFKLREILCNLYITGYGHFSIGIRLGLNQAIVKRILIEEGLM